MTIAQVFQTGDLLQLQQAVQQTASEQLSNGSIIIPELLSPVDCVSYNQTGIEFQPQGFQPQPPDVNEVMVLTTCVSLCGTDIDLIDKAKNGSLPAESIGKIVGHEGAGLIVGLGSSVKNWQLGQMVNFDSHYACGLNGHTSFNDCAVSGKSCDGIVGGIRGTLKADGTRDQVHDGYWSRVIIAPASALSVVMPLEVATQLAAPSTLESLGNIYMIIGQLKKIGLLDQPDKTALIVSGLGATGYPLAAVASHYGFITSCINPSESKRQFAIAQGACQQGFADTSGLSPYLQSLIETGKITKIVIAVMVGESTALTSALEFLENLPANKLERKICIAFGLYHDPQEPMPLIDEKIPQRDFVFSRHSFTTAKKTEIYGVCGRDLSAWQTLMPDLMPRANGQPPKLIKMLNNAQHVILAEDPLQEIARILQGGSANVKQLLKDVGKLKLVANLLTTSRSM